MKLFAISDLHMSTVCSKPMDIYGKSWDNYIEKISSNWQREVTDNDIVLLPGDLSWAMRMEEALPDLAVLAPLPGYKVILRGNHDYWWNTISQVRSNIPNKFYALQNDCIRINNALICGSRGWMCPDGNNLSQEDNKIYLREVERLKLSLQAMDRMRRADDCVVAMMHYPPFNGRYEFSDFVGLFVKFGVTDVVYGHLHGKDSRTSVAMNRFGIDFYLTSCDLVDNKLVLIKDHI